MMQKRLQPPYEMDLEHQETRILKNKKYNKKMESKKGNQTWPDTTKEPKGHPRKGAGFVRAVATTKEPFQVSSASTWSTSTKPEAMYYDIYSYSADATGETS